MSDVITQLREAADRTRPPSAFDLQATVRRGETRLRRRRVTGLGAGAALTLTTAFAGVVAVDPPWSDQSGPADATTVVPREMTWAERYEIAASIRADVQAALAGSPATGDDIGLPTLTGPTESPGSAWNLNLATTNLDISYARSADSITGWFSSCPDDADRIGTFEVGTTSCTVGVAGDRVIVQAVDRLPIPLSDQTTGEGNTATMLGVRSVRILDDGAVTIVSSTASHAGDPDDEQRYAFTQPALLSIASTIDDEMRHAGPVTPAATP